MRTLQVDLWLKIKKLQKKEKNIVETFGVFLILSVKFGPATSDVKPLHCHNILLHAL